MRNALGYTQRDLYGVSYSGRLALAIGRDFPQGVRSMIFDSPSAPDTRLAEEFASIRESFAALFAACGEDRVCATRFPDLRKTLERLVFVVDGNRLLEMLFWSMYSGRTISEIPAMILSGRHDPVTRAPEENPFRIDCINDLEALEFSREP